MLLLCCHLAFVVVRLLAHPGPSLLGHVVTQFWRAWFVSFISELILFGSFTKLDRDEWPGLRISGSTCFWHLWLIDHASPTWRKLGCCRQGLPETQETLKESTLVQILLLVKES